MKTNRRGFTLVELMIALALSSLVLYAIFNVVGSMTKFQGEAVRKSSVNVWSEATLSQMTTEIENANLLYFPSPMYPGANGIMGCANWSSSTYGAGAGGALNPSSSVTLFYYCYDTTSGPIIAPNTQPVAFLRRISRSGVGVTCPPPPVNPASQSCNAGTVPPGGGGGVMTNDVIATEVNLNGTPTMFTFNANNLGEGVNLNFIVGVPTSGYATSGSGSQSAADIVNAQYITVQRAIAVMRPYMNSND